MRASDRTPKAEIHRDFWDNVKSLGEAKHVIGGIDDFEEIGEEEFSFLLATGLQPEMRLLDLGCGCGRLAVKAIPYLRPGNYTGCDISRNLLGWAVKLADGGYFQLVDGMSLPYRTGAFDRVVAFSVFTHTNLTVTLALLKEIRRLLRPTGLGFVTASHAPDAHGRRREGDESPNYEYDWRRFIGLCNQEGLTAFVRIDERHRWARKLPNRRTVSRVLDGTLVTQVMFELRPIVDRSSARLLTLPRRILQWMRRRFLR